MLRYLCWLFVLLPQFLQGQAIFDFGVKGNYEVVPCAFLLKNATQKTAEVVSVRSSCPCATATIEKRLIPPSGIGEIHCLLDPVGIEGKTSKSFWVELQWLDEDASASQPGVLDGSGETSSDVLQLTGSETTLSLLIKGEVRSRVRLSSHDLIFTTCEAAEVTLKGYAKEATIRQVTCPEDSCFTYALSPDKKTLTITPANSLLNSNWIEQWKLAIDDDKVKELKLSVRSLVNTHIVPIPDIIFLQGKPQSKRILFRGKDKKMSFRLKSAVIKPGDIQLKPTHRNETNWAVLIDKKFLEKLPYDAKLLVETDMATQPLIVIPICRK